MDPDPVRSDESDSNGGNNNLRGDVCRDSVGPEMFIMVADDAVVVIVVATAVSACDDADAAAPVPVNDSGVVDDDDDGNDDEDIDLLLTFTPDSGVGFKG